MLVSGSKGRLGFFFLTQHLEEANQAGVPGERFLAIVLNNCSLRSLTFREFDESFIYIIINLVSVDLTPKSQWPEASDLEG